jgi:hypothetical protein
MNNYIKIFSCYIPVKGASRSTFCDLQNNSLILIPNALYNLIPSFDILSEDEVIVEYIDFLFENHITSAPGFLVSLKNLLRK